jgi:DNA polymerase III alpha subunit
MEFPASALRAIGRIFNATLTLLTPAAKNKDESDEIQKTVNWLKGIFENDFSAINVKQGNEPEKKFGKAVIAAIAEENIDLIAVVIGARHHRNKSGKNKNFIQGVITNDEYLPVLCL